MEHQNKRERSVFAPHYQVRVNPSDLLREASERGNCCRFFCLVEIHVAARSRLNPVVLLCSSAPGKSEGGSFGRRGKFILMGLKVVQMDSGLGLGV